MTTGTGSGKTESFLIPVLDHCRRAREAGKAGIKAVRPFTRVHRRYPRT
ncbi:hypothetical protein [Streptomyces sp. DSM 15324]|nr:hypothetical protein [Streptomyces sp. DSM 15324]